MKQIIFILISLLTASCASIKKKEKQEVDYVNPLIGTPFFVLVRKYNRLFAIVIFLCFRFSITNGQENESWQLKPIPIHTIWSDSITPESVLPEYPRPQFERKEWLNLNGLWNYAITSLDDSEPSNYDGKILVPYCIQSALSGVRKLTETEEVRKHALWYQRSFKLTESWENKQVLINFGAVDWESQVWVNGQYIGKHQGGYDAFSMNISKAIKKGKFQDITIRVIDPVGKAMGESVGKQREQPEYDGVTGIWQTIWLEPVADVSINRVKLTPDIDNNELKIEPFYEGTYKNCILDIQALDNGKEIAHISGDADNLFTLKIPDPKLWTPDNPFLYDLKLTLKHDGKIIDEINSYFGMRKISIGKVGAINRILLNNKPLFMIGPLDQGIWPESVLTPPCEEAIRFDMNFLKEINCNMIRLHMNSKPDRWYYACDKSGILVWQDFICGALDGNKYSDVEEKQWMTEQNRLMNNLYNHPSVVMWILFNEGWSQRRTLEYSQWAGRIDPTRIIDAASGFYDQPGAGHVRDMHIYINTPAMAVPEYEPERAVVLGEWGGFVSEAEDNNWDERRPGALTDDEWVKSINWPKYSMGKPLMNHYSDVVEQLIYLKELGLCGAVYTQLADMKKEQNGYLSMDRKIIKMDVSTLCDLHSRLINEQTETCPIIEASVIRPQQWKYSTQKQKDNWFASDFDDKNWKTDNGPFGYTPGFVLPKVNTQWQSDTLYLRKSFQLDLIPEKICLRTYVYGKFGVHNTCDIYINGYKVKEVYRWHEMREEFQVMTISLCSQERTHLKIGKNQIAVQVKMPKDMKNRIYDIGIYKDK